MRPDMPALVSLLRRLLVLRAPEPWIDADDKNVVEASDAGHSASDVAAARYQTMLFCLDTLELLDGRVDAETTGGRSPSQLHMGVYVLQAYRQMLPLMPTCTCWGLTPSMYVSN